MARIEKQHKMEEKIETVKKDVVKEVRRSRRGSRPALTCSLVTLIIFAGLLVWATWAVAATGFVRIPIFTTLAYDTPEPTRVVSAGTPVEVLVEQEITSELTSRLQKSGGELLERSIKLAVSEESITASLRSITEESGMDMVDTSRLQTVVDQNLGIELFVPMVDSDLDTALIILFTPSAIDGNILVDITNVEVGSLSVSPILVVGVLEPFISEQIRALNQALGAYARVDSVIVSEGVLEIVGEISVEIQTEQ